MVPWIALVRFLMDMELFAEGEGRSAEGLMKGIFNIWLNKRVYGVIYLLLRIL